MMRAAAAALLIGAAPGAFSRPAAYHWAAGNEAASGSEDDPLDRRVAAFRALSVPIGEAFQCVSRSYGITIVLEPGLMGEAAVEVRGGTVRDVVDALARSQGFYWRREGRLIAVRKDVLRFYEIDYPQMTRSAQGSSSVVLSAQAGIGSPTTNPPVAAAGAVVTASPASGLNPYNQNDQTNLSIQQQNQTTFWADVLSELNAMAQKGETVAVNKLAGVALVTASPARQDDFKAFIGILNRRISQQVRISARVLEVSLGSQHELGVDWALAATRAGGLALSGFSTATGFSQLNGETLIPSTISGTISTGKVSAVVNALGEQGEVRAVSNPSVLSLSNQTAFVKVGTEQTFFSLSNATTLNAPTAVSPTTATTLSNYSQNAITIGTVLYVTPEVNADGTVTVDVLPAITQLIGVDSSPDGLQTAPRMDIKALSTIARLHPGESVMIGGLIYDETAAQTQKVPGVGDLPLIGKLFATTAKSTSRTELVIFLSAEVVK
jgi:MSHA type pilus biogenesis protein MshL